MKCIRCSTDNTLKDRTDNQGRCKNCQHPFAFEPTAMGQVKITDPMFAKTIADLSANNTLFFTSKQFLYYLDKRLKLKSTTPVIGYLLFYLIPTTMFAVIFGRDFFSTRSDVFSAIFIAFLPIVLSIITITLLVYTSQSTKISNKGRRNSAKSLQIIGCIILAVGITTSLVKSSFLLFSISVILGMVALYFGSKQRRQSSKHQEFTIDTNLFQGWLDRWQQVNGSAQNLLPPTREERTPTTVNPDVTAYSFDRLVVCDTAAIAHLLIANNFHFENNCAILSITGYPKSIFETTMTMLRRNPELKVYAFHDCTPRGIGLIHQLKTSAKWFQNSTIEIFDVGLLPRQVFPSKSMFIQNIPSAAQAATQLPTEVQSGLSAEELKWLKAGNYVELESFTPQQLIRILNRGIAGSRALGSDDSSLIFVDNNAGSSYYVVESFG